jgi:hypothetical protein
MDEANFCGRQWCVRLARAVQGSRIAKGATSGRRHRIELDLQRLRLRQIRIDQHYDAGARQGVIEHDGTVTHLTALRRIGQEDK